jgi:UbiD family decarboxylase
MDPETGVPNVGVYRLQRQSVNTMTVHWLSVRGGARHLRKAAALGKKLDDFNNLGNTWRYASMGQDYWSS